METTSILDIPKGAIPPSSGIGTLGAFFQPSESCGKKLVRADERLIRELVSVLDRQLVSAVDARSDAEFRAVRENLLPRYVRALRALNDTVVNLVSVEMLESMSDSIVLELAADLENQRDRFGDKLTDQAIFTLWTIQKIRTLTHQIAKAGRISEEKRTEDNKLKHEYLVTSLWAQFHLDVLFCAVKFDRAISKEIMETVCNGLRAAINAFVIMKDSLALRQSSVEAEAAIHLPWDEEDEQLLASSMRDMNEQPSTER